MIAQGNALGYGVQQKWCALKGRRGPPPYQVGKFYLEPDTWGVAPGWIPSRRWRDNFAAARAFLHNSRRTLASEEASYSSTDIRLTRTSASPGTLLEPRKALR